MVGSSVPTPVTSLTPIAGNGAEIFGVYVFSEAADTLRLSELGPTPNANFFCNYDNLACAASEIGEVVDLGIGGSGLLFSLEDASIPNFFDTDSLGADGYAHDFVSSTVDAGDALAVAAAFGSFGQGPLDSAAANSIALLGPTPGTLLTFIGWEDRLNLDYDYNDLIFAFAVIPITSECLPNDPECVTPLPAPEPHTLPIFALGLAAIIVVRRKAGPLWRASPLRTALSHWHSAR